MVLKYDRNCEKEANKVITSPQILRKPFTIVSHYFGICPLSDVSHSLQIILKQMCCGQIYLWLGKLVGRRENYKMIKRLKIFNSLEKHVITCNLHTVSSLEKISCVSMFKVCYGKVKINSIKFLYSLLKLNLLFSE